MRDLTGMRVAIYARFSTDQQRDASIDDQVRLVQDAANRYGLARAASSTVFGDRAVSGASLHRPEFEKMFKLAQRGEIDVILTEDMSRISRDFADAAGLFKQLHFMSVPLIGISDGIDTSAPNAKLSFMIRSFQGEQFLDDLRAKTLRGLVGRAHAGLSTGGLPLGYRSLPVNDATDRTIGHRIEIDEDRAPIVRRIFEMYLEGRSIESIARDLNAEHVPPARAKTRHRRKGWVASTVRAMLHNEAYAGVWTFNARQWMKLPGTNIRRPRRKAPEDVIRREYPERRIIDETLWGAVQARLAAVRGRYVKNPSGAGRAAAATGQRNSYVLSGLLYCALCEAPMTIHAGTSARYYRCSDGKKRGTCPNKLSLREDVAKRRLIEALHDRYAAPSAVKYLRKKIAEFLGAASREANREMDERRARLARTEEKIAGLIQFVAKGDQSEYIRQALLDQEELAKVEKAAIRALRERASEPVELPTPEDVAASTAGLAQVMDADPLLAREQLRSLFEGGRLLLTPQPEGFYVAEGRFDLLAFLRLAMEAVAPGKTSKARTSLSGNPGLQIGPDLWSSHRCAGRI